MSTVYCLILCNTYVQIFFFVSWLQYISLRKNAKTGYFSSMTSSNEREKGVNSLTCTLTWSRRRPSGSQQTVPSNLIKNNLHCLFRRWHDKHTRMTDWNKKKKKSHKDVMPNQYNTLYSVFGREMKFCSYILKADQFYLIEFVTCFNKVFYRWRSAATCIVLGRVHAIGLMKSISMVCVFLFYFLMPASKKFVRIKILKVLVLSMMM